MNHFMADATKFPRTDCSTIIVGKNVSTTGRVLLAHNEDDPNCVVQSHLVPRMQHAEGETIIACRRHRCDPPGAGNLRLLLD